MRDVSTRFIQTVSKQTITALKVPQHFSPLINQAVEQLKSGGGLTDVLASLQNQSGANSNDTDNSEVTEAIAKLEMVKNLLGGIEALQPGAAEAAALVAEMRLVLPNRLVNLAELVAAVGILQQLAANLPGVAQAQTKEFDTLMNAFVNGVRKEMGLEPYKATGTTVQNISEKVNELLANDAE